MLVKEQGNLHGRPEVREILERPAFSPAWHTVRQAYLYPMDQHQPLVTQLRRLPRVLVEDVPTFLFRCTTSARQQRAADVDPLDASDPVVAQLLPFQRTGVDFILARGGRGMIADDMGLGKTVQAIAVAHHYRHEWPVLVVCPMSLMENWAKEFNRFASIAFSRITVLQGGKARATSLHDIVIVPYSSLKSVEGCEFRVVILDESHYIKAADTKRTHAALRLCRAAQRVLLLSGTPAMSRPMELYTQLQAIHPGWIPSKTQYAARYCNAYVSRFAIDCTGHSHIDELHFLLQHFVIRRTKKELGNAGLPAKTRQLLYVYITDKERKSLEKQVSALRGTLGTASSDGTVPDSVYNRVPNAFELKMATARAKIPAVQDYVATIVEQHVVAREKLILFAHHTCMMEAMRSAVEAVRPRQPVDYVFISGETPAAQREQLATHFREEPTCCVAILSMQSSGTGHNFTCASTVVFAELDWNPSTHLQCEDRVHRIGQSSPCLIKYLLAEGTSDSVVWPLLQTKLSVTSAFLENDSGDHHHLQNGADRQKVARRNVSPPKTQGTLDGFLRLSQSSQLSAKTAGNATSPRGSGHLASTSQSSGGIPLGGGELDAAMAAPPLPESSSVVISVEEWRQRRPTPLPERTTLTGAARVPPVANHSSGGMSLPPATTTVTSLSRRGEPPAAATQGTIPHGVGQPQEAASALLALSAAPVSLVSSRSVVPSALATPVSVPPNSITLASTNGSAVGCAPRTAFTWSSKPPTEAPPQSASLPVPQATARAIPPVSSSPPSVVSTVNPSVAPQLTVVTTCASSGHPSATPTVASGASSGQELGSPLTLVRVPMRLGLKRRLSSGELPVAGPIERLEAVRRSGSLLHQQYTESLFPSPAPTRDGDGPTVGSSLSPTPVLYSPMLMAGVTTPATRPARTCFVWTATGRADPKEGRD